MNRNVGASFGLSVVTVLFFAVVLYQPDRPAGAVVGASGKVEGMGPVEVAEAVPPRELIESVPVPPPPSPPSPSLPLNTSRASVAAPQASRAGARTIGIPAIATKASFPRAVIEPKPRPAGLPSMRPEPVGRLAEKPVSRPSAPPIRGGFAQADAGETLPDVALRVYGTADAVSILWQANRDILERPDSLLTAGSLLRTP